MTSDGDRPPEDLEVPGPTIEDEKVLEPRPFDGNDSGTQEAVQLTQGKTARQLKKDADQKEHDRAQAFKDHFEHIAIWYLWSAAVVLFLAGLSLAWNMLAPEAWHYLSEAQVTKLQTLLTGGVLVGVLSSHFKKRIG